MGNFISTVNSNLDNNFIKKSEVVNNLKSTLTDVPLSAAQGKVLQENLTNVSTKLNSFVKSKSVSITTNENGFFSTSVGANNKYWIIGVKESSGGIIDYSYHNATYQIIGFVKNWAGAVVPSSSFALTIYYIEL